MKGCLALIVIVVEKAEVLTTVVPQACEIADVRRRMRRIFKGTPPNESYASEGSRREDPW